MKLLENTQTYCLLGNAEEASRLLTARGAENIRIDTVVKDKTYYILRFLFPSGKHLWLDL